MDAVNTGDANEDGWMATRRPAITLRLTGEGTSAQVTCGKRGGELCVCGVGSLASSGAAERVEHSVSVGGIPALLKALQLRFAVLLSPSFWRAPIRRSLISL